MLIYNTFGSIPFSPFASIFHFMQTFSGLFQRICHYDEPQNGDEASPNRARGKLEDTKKTYIDMALNFDENSTPTFSWRIQKNFKIEMLTSRM